MVTTTAPAPTTAPAGRSRSRDHAASGLAAVGRSAVRHAYLAEALPAWTAPALRARLQGFLGARKPGA